MGVGVPQDGDGLHGVGVPDADVRIFAYLTGGHLDLIWMHRQAEGDTNGQGETVNVLFFTLSIGHARTSRALRVRVRVS